MTKVWRWGPLLAWTATGVFLLVDGGFFVANLLKIVDGGWIPLTLGALIFVVMVTWREGVQSVRDRLTRDAEPITDFMTGLQRRDVARTPGVAAFLTRLEDRTPPLMTQYVRLTGSLQQTVVALTLSFEEMPRVAPERRADFSKLAEDFWRVNLRYGYMEDPDLGAGLAELEGFDRKVDLSDALFFGTRDYVAVDKRHRMSAWRIALFSFLFRNGVRITDRFNLPADRTIEIAREVKI